MAILLQFVRKKLEQILAKKKHEVLKLKWKEAELRQQLQQLQTK